MGKKVFVSYADENLAYSLKRIGKLAVKMNLFDEICLYTPADIPDYIKSSKLMQYKRGGGYWAWKPALIWETLQRYPEGTIIVYADAGCTLQKSNDWDEFFKIMEHYDTLCFQYKNEMVSWSQFGQPKTRIKYWSKKDVIDYFKPMLNNLLYPDNINMIWGGCLFVKNKNNSLLKDWLNIVVNKADLIIDPNHEEHKEQFKFGGFHTHDQAVITPLAYLYPNEVYIMEERGETSSDTAILGTRIRAKTKKQYLQIMLKRKVRAILGDNFFNKLKSIIVNK